MSHDPRIDAYIGKAQPFARPILTHLRELIHQSLPEVEEAIKWSRPFFLLDGKPLAMMAAFKAHAIFGFWRGRGEGTEQAGDAGGQYGRLTALADLPDDTVLTARILEAAAKARAMDGGRSEKPGKDR